MVRTKADSASVAVKAIGSSRKAQAASYNAGGSSGCSSPSEAKRKQSLGGNSVCPQDTPAWQKPITSLFKAVPRETEAKSPSHDEDKENQTSPIKNRVDSDSETESPVKKKKKKNKGKAPVGKKAVVKKSRVIESDEDE